MVDERPEYQSRPELRTLSSFPHFKALGEKPKGPIEKFLSYFADVRSNEGPAVLLLAVNVFLLLFAYYFLKTARESLILTEGGVYIKAYSSAGQAILLMLLVPLYGLAGTKVNRVKLVSGLTAFFASHLLIFSFLGSRGISISIAFYIWVGIFNVFVISQIWSFATDLYTESQGKRLFPIIGVGSSLGAWLGAEAAARLIGALHLNPYQLQIYAGSILIVCTFIPAWVNRIYVHPEIPEMQQKAEEKLGDQGGFQLVFKSRYLALIAALTVVLNLVNSTGEFILGKIITEKALEAVGNDPVAQQQFIGTFYGHFFGLVNLVGFLIQTFAVSRIFTFMGVQGSIYVLPVIALMSYSVQAVAPVLGVVRGMKVMENSVNYSLQNTVRQALFLPTSREAKYKAKAAIDTFFMRFGDVLQAGLVKVGAELSLGVPAFAWINVGLTLVWLWISSRLADQHRRMGF